MVSTQRKFTCLSFFMTLIWDFCDHSQNTRMLHCCWTHEPYNSARRTCPVRCRRSSSIWRDPASNRYAISSKWIRLNSQRKQTVRAVPFSLSLELQGLVKFLTGKKWEETLEPCSYVTKTDRNWLSMNPLHCGNATQKITESGPMWRVNRH